MTKTDQRTETEKDRTPSRKTEKTPANHPDGTTEVLKVHIHRFATKEQCKVKTVGRYKDLQLEQTGFQAVTCDSNVYRIQNLSKMPLRHKRKNKSSLAKCLSGTGLCHAIRSENFQNSGATDPSNKLDISPSSASNCSLR